MQIDIMTGRPVNATIEEKKAIEQNKLAEQAIQGKAAEEQLNSQEGNGFITLVQNYLARRIDELVLADPEAKAYIEILTGLGHQVIIGKKAAQRLVEMRLGKVMK